MTKQQATTLLQTKYPNAQLYKPSDSCHLCKKGSIAVIFTPNGKVYSYTAKTYKELLEKLSII